MQSPNTRVVATESAAPTLASLLPLGLGVVAGASVVFAATWLAPVGTLALDAGDVAAVEGAVVVVVVVVVVVDGISVVEVVVVGAAVLVVVASVLESAAVVVGAAVAVVDSLPSTTPSAVVFAASSLARTRVGWSVESAHTSRRIAKLRDELIVYQET